MRRCILLGALVALAMPVTVQAKSPHLCEQAATVRASVVHKHGKRAPGRDICEHGMRGGRKPSNAQKARYLRALKRLDAPAPAMLVRTAVPPPVPPAGTRTAGIAPGGTLSAIAQCESGGNPRAVSPDGAYTGLYQFDDATWRSVGGTGRAGDAPAAEQHRRAAALYAQRGGSPWPVCSR